MTIRDKPLEDILAISKKYEKALALLSVDVGDKVSGLVVKQTLKAVAPGVLRALRKAGLWK